MTLLTRAPADGFEGIFVGRNSRAVIAQLQANEVSKQLMLSLEEESESLELVREMEVLNKRFVSNISVRFYGDLSNSVCYPALQKLISHTMPIPYSEVCF